MGHARQVLGGSGLLAEPVLLPRARIRRPAKDSAGFLPTVFPQASAKRDFSGLPLFKALSVPTWKCLTRLSAACLRLDFLRRGNQGQKLPARATPELLGGFERQLAPGTPSAPRVFLVSAVNFAKCTTLPLTWLLSSGVRFFGFYLKIQSSPSGLTVVSRGILHPELKMLHFLPPPY